VTIFPRRIIVVLLGATVDLPKARNLSAKAGSSTISGRPADGLSIRKKCFDCVFVMKTRIGVLTSGGDCPGSTPSFAVSCSPAKNLAGR